jgi:hypothetical protein
VASTSVAICDESPLLQSIGPTVIKKKKKLEINKQRRVKINYPLFPVHKRSAPTLPQCRTRQWTKPKPDEKKNLPIDNIDQRNLLFIADQKKKIYVYLFATAVKSSVNFFPYILQH